MAILFQARSMLNGQTGFVYLAMWLPAALVIGIIVHRLAKRNPSRRFPSAQANTSSPSTTSTRGSSLVIRPLPSATFQCVHRHINGGYVGSSFKLEFDDGSKALFTFSHRETAEWALGKMNGVQNSLKQAVARGDIATAMAIDPFLELGPRA